MTILMYHKVFLESPTMWWVSVDNFYRQMLELKSSKVVYLDDYEPQNPSHVVITFDGVYKNVLDYALPILREFNYPFELFISSEYIGKDNSFDNVEPLAQFASIADLKLMVEMNGRLQWHTRSHFDLTDERNTAILQSELDIPEHLMRLDEKGFKWFAYPYGRFNEIVIKEVKQRFSGALSCHQGNDNDIFCLNRITVTDNNSFEKATIAVIIASYNYGSFLIEAIESVLRQTRMADEILITDDASDDNTYEIAKFYQEKYPHLIKVNRNEENLGIVKHFNKAVSLTTSDYITILGADNRYRSDFLEKTSVILDTCLDVGIAYSDFALFGHRAKLVYDSFLLSRRGGVKADKFFIINFPDFNEESKQELLTVGNFIHGSSMFRRQAFSQVGGYVEKSSTPEDYELFCRMIKAGWNAKRAPFPLLEYRQHSKDQANIRLVSFAELQFYKKLTGVLHTELQQTKFQLQKTQAELERSWRASVRICSASIVVPWWDHSELLELWERNLVHLPDAEIIFIDNGSGRVGKAALEDFCSRHNIKLIRNEENRGFAAANNQGAQVATGEYILHLNNDVKILNPLVNHLCEYADNGIAGPGPIQNEIGEIYIEGWALCIKRSTLQALGGWCEDYGPGYWDDVDLCYRAKLAGYSLTPVPDMDKLIRHQGNATGRDGRIDQLALHIRNRGIFISKYYFIKPKFIVDGVFFQLYQTGIARVWKSLLEEWAANGFTKHIVVLDRGGTAPKIPGIRYRFVANYDYGKTNADREMLQQVCDEEGADLFISSYYTTPLSTPSVFLAHDMIPELMGWNLKHPMWREKHYGIQHAAAYIAVSENTACDLVKVFPDISLESVTVAKNGVEHKIFSPASPEDINRFKTKYGISKPYFILVGTGGYKNTILFFKAFAQLYSRHGFEIVCTGSGWLLEAELRNYTSGSVVHMLQLSDEELSIAYSGAIALVYPSKYEGFGLPVLEAIACGCPVITCANASIPEVAGEAALYVNDDDVDGLTDALCDIQKPKVRNSLIAAGLAQAKKFSWSKMASTVSSALIDATLLPLNLKDINLIVFPDWSGPEESLCFELEQVIRAIATHPDSSQMTLLVDNGNIPDEDAALILSSVSMNLLLQEDLDVSSGPEISLVGQLGEMQWEALLPRIHARIVLENENQQAIARFKAENIPLRKLDSLLPSLR